MLPPATPCPPASRRGSVARRWIGSLLLFLAVGGTAYGLAAAKLASLAEEEAAAAAQPEPTQVVTTAVAGAREYGRTTTAIGTVRALRWVTLRNELPGTVREVHLETGAIVEEGQVLVALDVAVEEAELHAAEANARLAETLLGRLERARESRGASAADVDRARAELDVARAEIERIRAVIERKTVRAPFRARVGLSDVHEGQYLEGGTALTTLQGVDDAVHVDFTVSQDVAEALAPGTVVEVLRHRGDVPSRAVVEALDAVVDPDTRNATVRARLADGERVAAPGSAVRVRVPVGAPRPVVTIPVDALRKGPSGDHVFVVAEAEDGATRARLRMVTSGPVLEHEVVIESGLAPGEIVAATGSFKLYDGARVAVATDAAAAAPR